MKKCSQVVCVVLLIVIGSLATGCTSNNTKPESSLLNTTVQSSPQMSSTTSPKKTENVSAEENGVGSTPEPNVQEDSTSSAVTQMLKEVGLDAVVPLTKQTNSFGNTYYSGLFSDGKISYIGSIELCKSSSDASKRLNTEVNILKNNGYKTLESSSEKWRGYNSALESTAVLRSYTGSDGNQYLIQLRALK